MPSVSNASVLPATSISLSLSRNERCCDTSSSSNLFLLFLFCLPPHSRQRIFSTCTYREQAVRFGGNERNIGGMARPYPRRANETVNLMRLSTAIPACPVRCLCAFKVTGLDKEEREREITYALNAQCHTLLRREETFRCSSPG